MCSIQHTTYHFQHYIETLVRVASALAAPSPLSVETLKHLEQTHVLRLEHTHETLHQHVRFVWAFHIAVCFKAKTDLGILHYFVL